MYDIQMNYLHTNIEINYYLCMQITKPVAPRSYHIMICVFLIYNMIKGVILVSIAESEASVAIEMR